MFENVPPVPPAIVAKFESAASVPLSSDPQVAYLQLRAEAYVATLKTRDEVARYEMDRAAYRAEIGLPQVPVTNRGWRVLTARNHAVSPAGYLTVG